MDLSEDLDKFIKKAKKQKSYSPAIYLNIIRDTFSDTNDPIIKLVKNILTLGYDEDRKMSFSPQLVLVDGSRSFSIKDLTSDDEDLLIHNASEFPVTIKARIYDVLWSRKKHSEKNQCLENAIKSYMEILSLHTDRSIEIIRDEIEFVKVYIKRLKVLIPINNSINGNNYQNNFTDLIDICIENFIKKAGYENKFRIYSILPLFLNSDKHHYYFRLIKNFFYYDLMNISLNTPVEHSFKLLKSLARNDEKLKKYYTHYAEYYVHLADVDYRNRKLYQLKSHWLEKALEIYMSQNLDQKRFSELHKELLETQKLRVNEFAKFESEKTDISDITKGLFRDFDKEMSFIEILYNIATLPCYIKESYSELAKLTQERGFSAFFPPVYTDDRGRVISNDNSEKGRIIRYISDSHIRFTVQCLIQPTIYYINELHFIDKDSITEYVTRSPFVRPGHEIFYIRGIEAGFHGDWTLSTSFLFPEMESSLKFLLEKHGKVTSTFKPNNQKDKYSLESILKDIENEKLMKDVDCLLISALLNHDLGHNLRNEYSHGLKNYDYYYRSFGPLFLWWLAIRFLFIHNPIYSQKEIDSRELITPIDQLINQNRILLPEMPGIYAFWWIGDKDELMNSETNFILSGPNKEKINVKYDDWWPDKLSYPCLYVGKTTNIKARFSQHLMRKSEGRLHNFLENEERVKRKTTSCQLRYGIEQLFRDEENSLKIIMEKVAFSYRVDTDEGATIRRFYDEDRLIGLWQPWFNLDSER